MGMGPIFDDWNGNGNGNLTIPTTAEIILYLQIFQGFLLYIYLKLDIAFNMRSFSKFLSVNGPLRPFKIRDTKLLCLSKREHDVNKPPQNSNRRNGKRNGISIPEWEWDFIPIGFARNGNGNGANFC